MWFIGKWIEKGWITKAMGRTIELGILTTISSLAIGLLDNVDILIKWGVVDRQAFAISFATGTALSITAWLKKYARDMANDRIIEVKPKEEDEKTI